MYQKSISVCLCAVVLLALSVSTAWATAPLARPMPWLNGVTTESVYVCAESTNITDLTVQFGPTTGYGSSVTTNYTQITGGAGGGPSNYVHNIKLTGLLPNTKYHYRVYQGSTALTSDYAFWTAPLPGTPAKWGFGADCRSNPAMHNTLAGLLASHEPRMMVYGGDITYSWKYSDWDKDWFVPNQNALNATTPWVNATGNHEVYKRGAGFLNFSTVNNVLAFTQAPDRDGDDPAGNKGWYSFDYGDTHILILNSEVAHGPGSDQWNFAAADLAATNRKWKVVAFHRPGYTGATHFDANFRDMHTHIFEPNGVDMVLNGHEHYYQHNLVNGIHQMIMGNFGVGPQTPATTPWTVYDEYTYNFGIFETTATTLTLTVYRGDGSVIETVEISESGISALLLIGGLVLLLFGGLALYLLTRSKRTIPA